MNTKKQKLLLVNVGTKEFAQDFMKAASDHDIDCDAIRSQNSCFIIKNNQTKLYHLNQEIIPGDYSYAFIRLKGRTPHTSTLISRFLNYNSVPFNDSVNLSQTLQEAENQSLNDEKITQMISLSAEGLSVPDTIIFSQASFEKNSEVILQEISFPCVFKSSGAKGKAVWKVQNETELSELMQNSTHELMMIQELLKIEYDIRTLIFEDHYLGAIKRTSTDGFYTNVSKGGTAEKIDLTEEEIELSIKANRAVGLSLGGVDFARTPNGIKFFEVNKSPQVFGFQAATGESVPEKIVEIIKQK